MFNPINKTISLNTTHPTKVIINQDTLELKDEIIIQYRRSKSPIKLITISDTIQKEYAIKSKLSPTVYLNFFGLGIAGVIIDAFSNKRFTYPHFVTIYPRDSSLNYKTYRPHYKGDIFLNFNLPLWNWMSHQTQNNKTLNAFETAGLGISMDFFYTKNNFLQASINSINDLFTGIEFITASNINYETTHRENFATISNNHTYKRLSLGYGVAITRSKIEYPNSTTFTPKYSIENSSTNYAAGLIFQSFIQTGKFLHLGIIYKPSFYSLTNSTSIFYQQYIGFDLRFRFRVKKGTNTNTSKFRENFNHILFPQ